MDSRYIDVNLDYSTAFHLQVGLCNPFFHGVTSEKLLEGRPQWSSDLRGNSMRKSDIHSTESSIVLDQVIVVV